MSAAATAIAAILGLAAAAFAVLAFRVQIADALVPKPPVVTPPIGAPPPPVVNPPPHSIPVPNPPPVTPPPVVIPPVPPTIPPPAVAVGAARLFDVRSYGLGGEWLTGMPISLQTAGKPSVTKYTVANFNIGARTQYLATAITPDIPGWTFDHWKTGTGINIMTRGVSIDVTNISSLAWNVYYKKTNTAALSTVTYIPGTTVQVPTLNTIYTYYQGYPATASGSADFIRQAFIKSGYYATLKSKVDAGTFTLAELYTAFIDPKAWLAAHPILYTSYPTFFRSS